MSRFIGVSGRFAGAGAGFAVTHLSAVVNGTGLDVFVPTRPRLRPA